MTIFETGVHRVAAKVCDFHQGFLGLEEEHSGWIDDIRGRIPNDLKGTFLRNGPGTLEVGGQRYGHWFDGPGMISAVTFVDGKAHFRNRYVRTPKYVEEKQQGKILYRGFGTQLEGGFFANFMKPMSNPANTNIIWHADKLCAYYEGGQPYRLDPASLETEGVEHYDGVLKSMMTMSAHGKINRRTGHCINYGVNVAGIGLGGLKVAVDVYDINPQGKIASTCRIPLDSFPFLHDFGLTENYAIFLVSSMTMGMAGPLFGTRAICDAAEYRMNKPVQGIIVDLRQMKVVRNFELPPAFIVHFGNSYEKGDEIITDFVKSTDVGNFAAVKDVFSIDQVMGSPLCRYRINVKTGETHHEVFSHVPAGEFPSWNTRETCYHSKYAYHVAPIENGTPYYYNAIVKLDTETGAYQIRDYGENRYTSEALFAAREGSGKEDDGYMLSFVYDASTHKTEVIILDAQNLENEIAAVKLSHHVPFGFHGHFTSDVFTTGDAA